MIETPDCHMFTVDGQCLMAFSTGEVYILDRLASDLACLFPCSQQEALEKLGPEYDGEQIIKAYDELKQITVTRHRDHSRDNPPRYLRALCLNITHKCNLACDYCFAKNLTESDARSMDPGIIKASIDFLFRESGGVDRLQIDFFGGEPLMVFDRVKYGVEYTRSLEKTTGKTTAFSLTTNAMLLNDEILDFVKENRISLIMSLDGGKGSHDCYRKTKDGSGSFEQCFKNIKNASRRLEPGDYYIRGTFTAHTPDIVDALKFYLDQGFYNVSLEPVSAPDTEPYSLNMKHLENLSAQYRSLARWLLDKDICFYHFNLETDNPVCLTRRITGCGAGIEYLAVDPDGKLYPCHQFIDMEDYLLGSVYEGINNKKVRKIFRESTIYGKENCGECWARFYCSGGCHFQHFVRTGSINRPARFYCELFKRRLEASLWYNVRRKKRGFSEGNSMEQSKTPGQAMQDVFKL